MKFARSLITAAVTLVAAGAALADINIGVSLSLTGPGSGLGIPMQNQFKLFPKEIAGEKINLIILDDASDPGKGVSNARLSCQIVCDHDMSVRAISRLEGSGRPDPGPPPAPEITPPPEWT